MNWAKSCLSTILVVLIVSITACSITSSDGAGPETTVEALDGSTYTYQTETMPEYHSMINDFKPGPDDVIRIQSRMEGYCVTIISDSAFSDCAGIKTFVVPEEVATFGSAVFSGDSSLETIVFMGPMPEFKADTFSGIPAIKVMYLEEYADSWASFTKYEKEVFPVYTYASDLCSFSYFEFDGSVTIHKLISGKAIDIPSQLDVDGTMMAVTEIGPSSFLESEITSVVIPEGVTTIDIAAFKYCEYMETASLPSTLDAIADEAFRMPIDNENWNRSKLKEIDLPDGLRYIGFESFRMCYQLKEIVIPDSVTHYGDGAFRVCTSAESVHIGKNVKALGEFSFDNCFSLKTIVLPEGLLSIGSCAFYGDRSLGSVVIPDSVASIDDSAFYGCLALTSITMSDRIVLNGTSTFRSCPVQNVILTQDSNEIYEGGIIDTYFGSSWTLPEATRAVSLLTIDASKSISIDIPVKENSFIGFTERSVNTTGGSFYDGGTLLTGADRAGKTFTADSSWKTADIVSVFVDVEPSDHGSVTGTGTYISGSTVHLTAVPGKNYVFQSWNDGVTTAEREIKPTSDTNMTATFVEAVMYRVQVTIDPEGAGQVIGTGQYQEGETATLTVNVYGGHYFKGWSDGSTDNPKVFTVTSNVSLKAYFTDSMIEFDTNGGSGSVNSIYANVGETIKMPGYSGTRSGYAFGGWSVGDKTYAAGDDYTVTGSVTAKAVWNESGNGSDNTMLYVGVGVLCLLIVAIVAFLYLRGKGT